MALNGAEETVGAGQLERCGAPPETGITGLSTYPPTCSARLQLMRNEDTFSLVGATARLRERLSMKPFARLFRLLFLSSTYFGCLVAAQAQVVVDVISPSDNSRDSSPVHYIASASSPQCSQGIASMRIYSSPHISVYTVKSDHLDVRISIGPGYFNTVVQAWDNCGNVGSTPVNIVVRNRNLSSPRFLYDAEYSTGNVAGFGVNAATGALTSTGQVPVKAGKNPSQLTSDVGGYRLYVVNQGSQDLNAYFINRANGFLT